MMATTPGAGARTNSRCYAAKSCVRRTKTRPCGGAGAGVRPRLGWGLAEREKQRVGNRNRNRNRCWAEREGKKGTSTSTENEGGRGGTSEERQAGGGGSFDPSLRTKAPRRKAESTDAIATALTRRFGLAGGLAWVGVLAFGVVSEQVKTRLEVS